MQMILFYQNGQRAMRKHAIFLIAMSLVLTGLGESVGAALEPIRIPPVVSERLGGAEAITVSAWVARDEAGRGRRNDILHLPIRQTNVKILLRFNSDDKLRASGRTVADENSQGVETVASWEGDDLRHVAAVFDAANDDIRIYIDGARQETKGQVQWEEGVFSPDSGQMGAIGMASYGRHHFSGRIEDIRIYRRGLNDEEINRIWESDKTDEPGDSLVRRWLHPNAGTETRVRPATQAQKNALKRIAQLTEIEWRPVLEDTLPSSRGTFSGRTETGVPYSSVRGVGRWIGYDISFETFVTALQNPKSVLYTENLREEPYNVPNASIYYGLVCSSFVQYAFRDDLFWNTRPVHDNPEGANMSLIEEQSADGVELLAILNTIGGGHQEIVTDIGYFENEVVSIEVTDLTHSGPRKRTYSPSGFNKYLNDRNYLMYRYDIPDDLPYTPSKYVAVGDEQPQEITYNSVLALDRGNRTNYVKDSPVRFNIMDADANQLVVSRNGETVLTVDIAKTGVMDKRFSECGHYSAHCVMEDGGSSDPVEFIVAEVSISVPETVEAGEDILLEFAAQACYPRYVMMQHPETYSLSVYPPRLLTEQEISEGAVSISHDQAGSFYVVVHGVNEFGGVYSSRTSIRIGERE